jgi:CRISPR system Cascade subunit CasA
MASFGLTQEPWLPCETLDGTRVELSLFDALRCAHELRSLDDSSPLVTAALHRLLLAVLHRCFGPRDIDEWKRLYAAGRFDPQKLKAYLTQWSDRFDLLHSTQPFYQCIDENMVKFEADAPSRLVFERSNYGAPVNLFAHRPTTFDDKLGFADAARLLVAFQAFTPGGLIRKSGEPLSAKAAPLNRGAVVLVTGTSLFETLLCNLLVYRPQDGLPIPGDPRTDIPAWERDGSRTISNDPPAGWLDLLTWQSRRVLLKTDTANQFVTGVVVAVGRSSDTPIRDPMLAWKESEKVGLMPVSLSPERAFWRDAHALVLSAKIGVRGILKVQRPSAVDLVARTELRGLVPLDRRFSLNLFGMAGDQARILSVGRECLPVATKIMADSDLGGGVKEAILGAEIGSSSLSFALETVARRVLAAGEREPAPASVTNLVKSGGGQQMYWARLGHDFVTFLDILPTAASTARVGFTSAIRHAARHAFEQVARDTGPQANSPRAIVEGERQLRRGLARLTQHQHVGTS